MITGVQLGMLIALPQREDRLKFAEELEDQNIGNSEASIKHDVQYFKINNKKGKFKWNKL